LELKIFEILEEQSIIGFSGKLNVLDINTKEQFGYIVFMEGSIVNAKKSNLMPYKALMNLLLESYNNSHLDFIVEPELVTNETVSFSLSFEEFKSNGIEYINQYEHSKENRPSDSLQLLIKPSFLSQDVEMTKSEYNLLCTLSDFSIVKDVYENNEMLDYEITNALISLRKKDALKVVDKK
jgi:hypothetical protein